MRGYNGTFIVNMDQLTVMCSMLAHSTGYFTSRPALKGYAREMNSLLQVCKQLEVMGEPLKSKRQTKASSLPLRKPSM